MKKTVLISLFLFVANLTFAQGIEFKQMSIADAQKLAKKEKKAIFVDMYTSWCGPCKYLASDIFPKAKVGEYFNKNFVCLKYDAEKDADGLVLAKKHNVKAYPTLLFIDELGELVYRFMGVKDEREIIVEGEKAVNAYKNMPQLRKLEEQYEKGERSITFLNDYIILKTRVGHDCSKLLVDYFAQIGDDQIVDSLNCARLGTMTIYNEALLNRVTGLVLSKKSDKILLPAMKYMSASLSAVASGDDEKSFEEILLLKNKIYKELGAKDNFAVAFMGGATIFLPSNMLRLEYYKAKDKEAKFTALLPNYMKDVESAFLGLTPEEKAEKVSNVLLSMDDLYLTASMIENIDHYTKLNGGITDQTVEWYWILTKIYPACKNGAYIAQKLIDAARKDDAKAILTYTLENKSKGGKVEQEDLDKCNELFNSIK